MIDTLVIHQTGENGQDFNLNIKENGFKRLYDDETKTVKHFKVFYDGKTKEKKSPIYVYYSPNDSKLKLQFSVPKLIQGNSIENFELSELSELHSILENRLKGILDADFNNMNISRIDVSKNIEVENDVCLYLLACDNARAENKRYSSYKFGTETITFSNNSRRITLYDKIKEVIAEDRNNQLAREYKRAGRNILRFEIQHKTGKSISTHLKEVASDLSIETLYRNSKEVASDFKAYLSTEFQKFFCYSGQYEMFMFDEGLTLAIKNVFGKRNLAINTLARKYMQEHQEFKPFEFSKLFIPYYSERNILKIRKQIIKLQKLSNMTKVDYISEIESKLVA